MKKRRILIGLGVTFLIMIGYFMIKENKSVEVELFKVEKGNLREYIEETATVKSEDSRILYANMTGEVLKIMVDVGDKVKKGDLLGQIDDQELLIQRNGLLAQKSSLLAQYQEEKRPKDLEEIKKLEAQVNKEWLLLEESKRIEKNKKKMYTEGIVSFDEYQRALTDRKIAESTFESATMDLEISKKGLSDPVKKEYEERIHQIESELHLMDKKIDDLKIKSPIDGTLLSKEIKIGSYVQPGMVLMEIGNEKSLYLVSDILMGEIENIKEGAFVEISNKDLEIKPLKGSVRKIYPKAFSKISDLGIEQKRITVEIDFIDVPISLRPGYDMDIKIITEEKKNVLWILEDAIFEYRGEDYVFVKEKGRAVLRKIKKGIESEDKVEIINGLSENEEVVLLPDEKIEENIKLK